MKKRILTEDEIFNILQKTPLIVGYTDKQLEDISHLIHLNFAEDADDLMSVLEDEYGFISSGILYLDLEESLRVIKERVE